MTTHAPQRPGLPLEPEQQAAADRIATDLREIGVHEAGVLLVHSSLSSLGHVPGGPETVIRGLLQALGPEGTLLMPALSYERVRSKNPFFDVRRTPSNVGAIPEAFRRRLGTRRSVHPTHSVCAVGQRTAEMLDDHLEDSTPCGENSPFRKLRSVDGQILMLGCGLQPNTSMHAIEELSVPPYLFGTPLTYTLTLADGTAIEKTYTRHSFDGWEQRYDRVTEVLQAPALVRGNVLEAKVHLIRARRLWEAVDAALGHNPLRFVDRVEHDTHSRSQR
jgi:aminoglycoside 3-N-acetyltransferase